MCQPGGTYGVGHCQGAYPWSLQIMNSRSIMMLLLIVYAIISYGFETAVSAKSYTVVFDDSPGLGRVFDGVGGLSGGGATSKLLVNYPDQQRDEILDYLFKPNFGASLQILKVEIGGDVQSTDGTEASHMHNSWDENYQRGYEWWLMKEAKKRNPDIKLYGLPWGFPGWVGNGTRSPYVNNSVTVDYLLKWVTGAKTYHNLTIDYLGIWNEHQYNPDCIKLLRRTLDERGLQNVLLIMPDGGLGFVKDMKHDAALSSAVHAVGVHYPGTFTSEEAVETGKQLWASEDYSTFNDEVGGGCWGRILNQNYVNGFLTSTISWNLIGSYYSGLIFYSCGLMTAAQPWSGNYIVKTPIWLSAHTTQFTSPGWQYLTHGKGIGKLPRGGSYVSLVSPERDQLSIIIETLTHNHSQCIRPYLPEYNVEPQEIIITLKGSFAPIAQMNVWYSKLGFGGAKEVLFEKMDPIKFKNGQAKLKLGLDEVFTLTTVAGGNKGSHPEPPPPKPFPLPYKDDFEDYQLYEEPNNLAQQMGAFEVLHEGQNQFIRQMVLTRPVLWCNTAYLNKSYSIIGDIKWINIFVEIDFQIPSVNGTTGVFVGARAPKGSCKSYEADGIFFFVLPDKYIVANNLGRVHVLKDGPISFKSGWHKLSLLVQNGTAMGALDEESMFSISIPMTPANGWAAIGTDSYGLADFDNLNIMTAEEGFQKMTSYFDKQKSNSLYFIQEHSKIIDKH